MPLEDFINRITFAGDKRTEFNEAARPIRAYLLAEINGDTLGRHPPTHMEVDNFLSKLSWIKRRRFLRAYIKQVEERQLNFRQDFTTRKVYYESTEGIVSALKLCLPYTEPK